MVKKARDRKDDWLRREQGLGRNLRVRMDYGAQEEITRRKGLYDMPGSGEETGLMCHDVAE